MRVRLVRSGSNTPIRDTSVHINETAARTDANGELRLDLPYEATIVADGFASTQASFADPTRAAVVVLCPLGRLVGTVTDTDGVGVPNASIDITAPTQARDGARWAPLPTAPQDTDSSGRFAFAALPTGVDLIAQVKIDGALLDSHRIRLAAGVERAVTWTIAKMLTVAGEVRDELGRPIEGARVYVQGTGVAHTSSQGRFEVQTPLRSVVGVRVVRTLGDRTEQEIIERIDVRGSPARVFRKFEVAAHFIRGVVVDATGAPVAGIIVQATVHDPAKPNVRRIRTAAAESSPTGAFTLGPIAAGQYRLTAGYDYGFRHVASTLAAAGATGVTIRLAPAVEVRGRLRLPELPSGLLVTYVRLVPAKDERRPIIVHRDRSEGNDADIPFLSRGVAPGLYTIVADVHDPRAKRSWVGVLPNVRLLNPGSTSVDVRMVPATLVTIRATGSNIGTDGEEYEDVLDAHGVFATLRIEHNGVVVHRDEFMGSATIFLPHGSLAVTLEHWRFRPDRALIDRWRTTNHAVSGQPLEVEIRIR